MQEIYAHTLAILAMHTVALVYLSAAYLDGGLDARLEEASSTPESIQVLHSICAKVVGSLTTQAAEASRSLLLVNVIPTRDKQNMMPSVHTLAESSVSITFYITLHHV